MSGKDKVAFGVLPIGFNREYKAVGKMLVLATDMWTAHFVLLSIMYIKKGVNPENLSEIW